VKLQKIFLLLASIVILLFTANVAVAQKIATPGKRLRSPATVRGFIGGESHDSYLIRARKGRTMTVQISWRREGDNRAEFSISESPDFFNGQQVNFGKSSDNGKRWTGKIPRTGDYYIYVIAHPTARYKLRVNIK
jgi:hypothetical protein